MTAIFERFRCPQLIGLGLAVAVLSGCQLAETQPEEAADPEAAAAEPVAEPAREPILQDVILALDAGRVDTAEDQLLQILERRPNSRLANRLLDQIRGDQKAELGDDYTEVAVAEGESLSQIAERELGDAMQFFALARYNDIEVPRRLEPGQMLRIPTTLMAPSKPPTLPPARPAIDEAQEAWVHEDKVQEGEGQEAEASARAAPVETKELLNATVGDLLETGRHRQARRLLTLVAYAGQLNEQGVELLAQAAMDSSSELEDLGELSAAVDLLESSRRLIGEADGAELAAERDRLQARVLFAEGMEHRRGDRPDEALARLERSAALDPTFAAAREEATRLRAELVQRRHEAALVHYRDQRLDAAIELWQAVVKLDPGFEPAQRYLTRARALLARLKSLD